ncbi:hypothetical protein [Lysinibacillus sp. FSL W8-0992]|uniref:hypothetical protein n=1 Tax=Lysinibacillus sp. FSL W8-0992 TaxID=2954643 RepID=UPI0030F65D87
MNNKLWQFQGHNVTATRYHFLLVGNDYEQTYQIIDIRNGRVIFQNDDEDECLSRIILLGGIDSYNTKVIDNFS